MNIQSGWVKGGDGLEGKISTPNGFQNFAVMTGGGLVQREIMPFPRHDGKRNRAAK
ncbi:MAG: hypothetical protein Q4A62_10505 [Eikenella sp.]|nr:hypothetical protein [Eikenella sp.]